MALPIKKIYIDTKYKSSDSISNSNFKINLPQSLSFPEDSVFYVDDVSIPHSWYTIEKNINDKLYVIVSPITPDEDNSGVRHIDAFIAPGVYNGAELALEIEASLRSGINNNLFPELLKCKYNPKKNNITIFHHYIDWQFKIMTDDDIATKLNNTWIGDYYDSNNSRSMNEVIGNVYGNSPWYNTINSYTSNVLNLQSIRNIYIHSSLGNYNTIGPRNESSIVKKVPVTAPSSEYIFDQVMMGNDYIDCSKQTVRSINFELKDVHGNHINFHNSNLSFSLIFSKMQSEM